MAHRVVKPFPYAEDGMKTRQTTVDEVLQNVDPAHVDGLVRAGYIVADGGAAETLSKVAGEAIAAADHAGIVDSDKAVKQDMASAQSRISDGNIGAPEARTILDAHALTPLSDPVTVAAAQAEKEAHEKGDTTFDPKSPEAVAAAKETVEAEAEAADKTGASAFDHDGDGKPGGAPAGGNAKKAATKK